MPTAARSSSSTRQGKGAASGNGRAPKAASRAAIGARSRSQGAGTASAKRSGGSSRGSSKAPTRGSSKGPTRKSSRASAGARRSGASTRGREAGTRSRDAGASAADGARQTAANGASANGSNPFKEFGVPVATGALGAAAGIAGGVFLGRTVVGKRQRKVLGVKLPGQRTDFSAIARSVSDAGKQFGKLASEVRATRKKAEEIGKVLS